GLPVPLLIIWAPSWGWIVFANVLLGVNQGLCWSTTVIRKIDLVGPARRGLGMGLNEFAGYIAVSLSALLTGYLAAAHGLRPAPFYPGIAFAVVGLVVSVFAVRETRGHARAESRQLGPDAPRLGFGGVFLLTSWRDRALFAASQAGMVNNLNDGMVWGLIPVFLAARGVTLDRIGVVTATYPLVWGMGQLATGALSDRWGRKWMIASGMWVQGVGITAFVVGRSYASWMAGATLLGIGTAVVYPTLLAAGDRGAAPEERASQLPASVKNVEQIRTRHRAEEVHEPLGCRNPLEATWLRVRDPATDGEGPGTPVIIRDPQDREPRRAPGH